MLLPVFWLLILTLLAGMADGGHFTAAADQPPKQRRPDEMATIRKAMAAVAPLFRSKGKPRPSDWLANHSESGQTFDQYIASDPNRPTPARTTIYMQPLGTFGKSDRKLIDATADLLGRFYNVPVKTLDALSLDVVPAHARRKSPQTGASSCLPVSSSTTCSRRVGRPIQSPSWP